MLTFNLIMLGTLLAGRHHIFYIIANSINQNIPKNICNNDNHEDDEKERDWSKCETFHFILWQGRSLSQNCRHSISLAAYSKLYNSGFFFVIQSCLFTFKVAFIAVIDDEKKFRYFFFFVSIFQCQITR